MASQTRGRKGGSGLGNGSSGEENQAWLDAFCTAVAGGTAAGAGADDKEKSGMAGAAQARDPLTFGDDVEIVTIRSVSFWRRTVASSLFFYAVTLLTLGLAPMVAHWHLPWLCWLRYSRVSDKDASAEYALVESLDGIFKVCHIESVDCRSAGRGWIPVRTAARLATRAGSSITSLPISFVWRSERFWLHPKTRVWTRYRFNLAQPHTTLHAHGAACAFEDRARDQTAGPSMWERRFLTYGPNILHVDTPSFMLLLAKEILKPFFVFQIFSFGVWFAQKYFLYSFIVLILSVSSVVYEALQTWKNYRNIKRLAETECRVSKLVALPDASGHPRLQLESATSSSLLPGDLLQIEAGMVLPCDVVLLAGQCVVNEAMLTGESAPVLKMSLPLDSDPTDRLRPDSEADSKFRLLSGTTVVQTRALAAPPTPVPEWQPGSAQDPMCVWNFAGGNTGPNGKAVAMPVVAMVVGTGYSTAKGELVRAIVHPKPSSFDFERKLYYFIINLFVFLVVASTITIVYQVNRTSTQKIILNVLNLVTITLPPALPLSLSIGLSIAFTRLKESGIFCISPPRIINAGCVNTLCFDKTGTLTQDGLSARGVLPLMTLQPAATSLKFDSLVTDLRQLYLNAYQSSAGQARGGSQQQQEQVSTQLALTHALAACHSLSVLRTPPPTSFPELEIQRGSGGSGGSVQMTTYERGTRGSFSSATHDDEVEDEDDAVVVEKDGSRATFVGDPLEIQMFRRSGWGILCRPDPGQPAEEGVSVLPWISGGNAASGASPSWDVTSVWSHGDLPAFVDTVLVPPPPHLPAGGGGGTSAAPHPVLAVLRRFDFDSDLRRMSVLVARIHPNIAGTGLDLSLLVKGAPESLRPLCSPSTIPIDFDDRLHELALNGDRLLAAAVRPLTGLTLQQAMQAKRAELEQELTFSGFLVLENQLKPETVGFLSQYTAAGLRSIMVTGDNPLTAIAVARKCGTHFLLRTRKTFLVDSGEALKHGSTGDLTNAGGGPAAGMASPRLQADFGPDSTGCVLKDVFGHRSLPLDDVFLGKDRPVDASADVEDPVPLLSSHPLRGADLVVTGRAFAALKLHHDHAIATKHSSSVSSPTFHSLSLAAPAIPPATPLECVLSRAGVFARMSPGNKKELMLCLRDLGYSVCMTGDGANDSGALKAADVGVSIAAKRAPKKSRGGAAAAAPGQKGSAGSSSSSGEDVSVNAAPSIAAPFSTPIPHIGAVLEVLMEGRCTLVSATTMFKYMLFYGVIQTMALMVLYPHLLELYDTQYLWADLALVFPMVLLIPTIPPKRELSRGRPESNLLALSVLVSVYGQSALIIAFQLLANTYLHAQDWYSQPEPSEPGYNEQYNMNSSESFLFSSFQYIFLAIAMSQSFGKFRVYLRQCLVLSLILLGQFLFTSWFLLAPTQRVLSVFSLVDFSQYPAFKLNLWILALVNGFAAILFERFAVRHTSSEPDVLSLTHANAATLVEEDDFDRPVWWRALRTFWEDCGGSCCPDFSSHKSGGSGSHMRYAAVLHQSSPVWDRL